MNGTIETTKNTELLGLRQQVGELSNRRDGLRRQITAAKSKEAELVTALEASEEQLVAGHCTPADVSAAAAALHAHRAELGHAESALQKIEQQHSAVGGEVVRLEREAQRELEEQGAAPLRAEAEQCVETFVANLLTIGASLQRRRDLEVQRGREYPLARPIDRAGLDAIAVAVTNALRLDGNFHGEVKGWVARILRGPVLHASTEDLMVETHYLAR